MKRVWLTSLIWMALVGTLWSFPQYTSRENAIRLAKVIDKGLFKSNLIASAFVKNRSSSEFYVQIILDDGSSHDWLMDEIYEWVQTDQLLLSNNRVLVFPSQDSTDFYVFDKNAFYKLALTSVAFTKSYGQHDLLAERSMNLAIRRFRLIQPEESSQYATDRQGNRFRYVLEFQNGSREVLTYLSAYQLMQRGAFIQRAENHEVVLERPFQIQELKTIDKKIEDELRNIWSFGVEMVFDRPVTLYPEMFPFQVVEETLRDPETGERQTRFFIQVTFPNAEKLKELSGIRTLEYLQYISVVNDVENSNRLFLRAQINPQVFELPPYLEVKDNVVKVYFFIVTDQSIVKRTEYLESGAKVEVPVHPAFVPASHGTEFDKHYLAAVEKIRSVQGQRNLTIKINAYLAALDSLKQASLNTINDQQLAQSLEQRDVLLENLPVMILENTQSELRTPSKEFNKTELLRHLEFVEQISGQREQLKQVQTFKEALK